MKKLFFIATCALFALFLMKPIHSASAHASTAEEFAGFVERAQQVPFSGVACTRIADHLIRFCKFEGHYVETHTDLVNQKAYFGVLLSDYHPLFSALQALDSDSSNANAFFDCVLDVYTRNLRDQANLVRMGLKDDGEFGEPQKSPMLYTANGIDFFRDRKALPNYEAFVSKKSIRWLTHQHTSILEVEQARLRRIKETQTEYRQCVEDHLNLLLHMAWMTVQNRESLSNRTRTILAKLPYIHKILKQGPQCGSLNYDLLITDWLTNPENQLHAIFIIIKLPSHAFTTETPIPKVLLPNKKKKKKKKKEPTPEHTTAEHISDASGKGEIAEETDNIPTGLHLDDGSGSSTTHASLAAPTPSVLDQLQDELWQKDILTVRKEKKETKKSDNRHAHAGFLDDGSSSSTNTNAGFEEPPPPVLYQLQDWQYGRAVTVSYDLCQLTGDQHNAKGILESFKDLNDGKFISYTQVTQLYRSLGGVIVNKKGTHETWEFNKDGNKVKTTFFFLHDKDQYGPWTKRHVQQTIRDVLEPFLIQ